MKIAIQGHLTRGKEVIQILESLGGKNTSKLSGCSKTFYHIDKGEICNDHYPPVNYKFYTLEEFEKEFPFKIGDTVIDKHGDECYILDLIEIFDKLHYYVKYNYNQFTTIPPESLKSKKNMKDIRNITLTLDKAKEWYQKGGELKEIALQVFTKEELNPLPKSWEEYCKMYPIQSVQCITVAGCPKKYIALWKLEQLRDCYRQGWEPNWTGNDPIVSIYFVDNKIGITKLYLKHFLSFQSKAVAEEFLKNFEPLIKEAEDLI